MNYREILDVFSDCGLGAVLVAADNTILDMNEVGETLLCCEEKPQGKSIEDLAPFLLPGRKETFGNPAFNKYLLPCPNPQLKDLPPNTKVYVFRDATKDIRHDMLENVLNNMNDSVTIWDNDCRILMMNDAAAKLEAHLINNVLGRHVTSLYEARNDTVLVIPLIVKEKKPILNLRQDFVTHSGKELQIVSNNYPVMCGDNVVGATSLMEDWTKLEELSKRITELQRALLGPKDTKAKKNDNGLAAKYRLNDIFYSSKIMNETVDKCKKVAKSDASVMLYGETGTGKELFAQGIHNASPRSDRPFVAINCAAIPDTLLESMLFGTERGAYTGAEQREGLFEQADTGTLLLDEINSMNISLQSKLLRVLQDGVIRRVGGTKNIDVDVRVISNINIPPQQAIDEELLRQDLYYRLGVINITVPPLRERKEDIMLLAKFFISSFKKKLQKNASDIDGETYERFIHYDWPGNVRELQHAIEYAMNMVPDEVSLITSDYIPEHIQVKAKGLGYIEQIPGEDSTMESVMEEAGRRYLSRILFDNEWNITRAADALGISRQNLQYRMKKMGVKKES